MSYILDALKKSEKERASGVVPSLYSAAARGQRGVQRSWLVVSLAVILMVTAAVGVKLLWATAESWLTVPADDTRPDPKIIEYGQAQLNLQKQQTTRYTGLQNPVAVGDLDPSMRDRLPELMLNALSYSTDRSKRFVMINQRIFREGEEVGEGLSVEEITPTAVILKFEDVRIKMQP